MYNVYVTDTLVEMVTMIILCSQQYCMMGIKFGGCLWKNGCDIIYRIAGNIQGRKPSQISQFYSHPQKFSPRNFRHVTPIYATFRESFLSLPTNPRKFSQFPAILWYKNLIVADLNFKVNKATKPPNLILSRIFQLCGIPQASIVRMKDIVDST